MHYEPDSCLQAGGNFILLAGASAGGSEGERNSGQENVVRS